MKWNIPLKTFLKCYCYQLLQRERIINAYAIKNIKSLESDCSSVSPFVCRGFFAASSTWLHTDPPGPAAPHVCKEQKKTWDKMGWDKKKSTKINQNSIDIIQVVSPCQIIFKLLLSSHTTAPTVLIPGGQIWPLKTPSATHLDAHILFVLRTYLWGFHLAWILSSGE